MSKTEQFESFRRQREIELLEDGFREKAAEKRRRLEAMLESQDGSSDVDSKVAAEVQDFLSESTQVLSDVLGGDEEFSEFFTPPESLPEPTSEPQAPPAPPPVAPRPSESERKVPLDLKAALARIQRQGRGAPLAESAFGDPSPAAAPAEGRPETPSNGAAGLLQSFDDACDKVADVFREERETVERSLPPQEDLLSSTPDEPAPMPIRELSPSPAPIHEPSPFRERRQAPLTAEPQVPGPSANALRMPSPISDPTVEPAPAVPQPPEPVAESEGAPGGVTNVFEAEPDEDSDIDDDIDDDAPAGWDIPVRPPPPGAWVVAKQKEEGESGLSGAAGDTYLIKKLCQEVRGFNRLYLVLIEKGVVTREEVEGPLAAGERDAAADDDDDFSVEDYAEDRYRPILIDEKDFSLSSLVGDVHRLKALRETLLKKGVVSKKDLERQME